jgi:hypothetical protein
MRSANQIDPATLALIAAVLDPGEVLRTETTNELPNCLPAALDLVNKAKHLLNGEIAIEELSVQWRERFRQSDLLYKIQQRAKWKLVGPEQHTLAQAVQADWCDNFKTEARFKALLKRVGFPFEIFGEKEILITRATCELALELDREAPGGKERDRKRKNCSTV